MGVSILPLAAILLFALVFQILHLDASSLWHDEAFSGLLPQYGFGEMMHRITLDVHPPLYYILLRFWTDIAGNSLFTIRLFSMIFGVATTMSVYILSKEFFSKKGHAALAASLLFLSSFQIQYNMEARMYTLGSFFVVLSTLFLLYALKASTRKIWWWLGYSLLVALALYTHYYTIFVFFAHGAFILFLIAQEAKLNPRAWLQNATLRISAFSALVAGLLFLLWIPIFLKQLQQVEKSYWIPPMNWWSIPSTVFKMVTGIGLNPQQHGLLLIGTFVFVCALLPLFLFLYKKKEAWLLVLLLVTPFVASTLLSFKTSIYLDRYFIFFLPFLIILITAVCIRIRPAHLRRLTAIVLIGGAFGSFLWYWNALEIPKKPGMAQAASYLNLRARPGDSIFAGSSFVLFTFRYYNKTSTAPLLYAQENLPHFSGTALLKDEDVIKEFPKSVSGTAWKIDTTGFGNFQPAVPLTWTLVSERIFQDIYDYRGSIIVREYQTKSTDHIEKSNPLYP